MLVKHSEMLLMSTNSDIGKLHKVDYFFIPAVVLRFGQKESLFWTGLLAKQQDNVGK